MNEQAFFTVGTAAKATGKSKATISNAIKNGRLSVHEKTANGYRIAASELFRVFSHKQSEAVENEQSQTPDLTALNAVLERENELLRERLDELKADRDHWRTQATALLPDRRPFWKRLFER